MEFLNIGDSFIGGKMPHQGLDFKSAEKDSTVLDDIEKGMYHDVGRKGLKQIIGRQVSKLACAGHCIAATDSTSKQGNVAVIPCCLAFLRQKAAHNIGLMMGYTDIQKRCASSPHIGDIFSLSSLRDIN